MLNPNEWYSRCGDHEGRTKRRTLFQIARRISISAALAAPFGGSIQIKWKQCVCVCVCARVATSTPVVRDAKSALIIFTGHVCFLLATWDSKHGVWSIFFVEICNEFSLQGLVTRSQSPVPFPASRLLSPCPLTLSKKPFLTVHWRNHKTCLLSKSNSLGLGCRLR